MTLIVMMLTLSVSSVLISGFSEPEAKELEEYLAKQRAWWAMVGSLNYLAHRARLNPWAVNDAAKLAALTGFYDDLADTAGSEASMDTDADWDNEQILWLEQKVGVASSIAWEYPEYLGGNIDDPANAPSRYVIRVLFDNNNDIGGNADSQINLTFAVLAPQLTVGADATNPIIPSVAGLAPLVVALSADVQLLNDGQFTIRNMRRDPTWVWP